MGVGGAVQGGVGGFVSFSPDLRKSVGTLVWEGCLYNVSFCGYVGGSLSLVPPMLFIGCSKL